MKKGLLLFILFFTLSSCDIIYIPSSDNSFEESFSYSQNSEESISNSSNQLIDLSQVFFEITKHLDVDNITNDIVLTSNIEGLIISCVSEKPDIISNDGKLFVSEKDEFIRYTITLSLDEETYSNTLLLTVKGRKFDFSYIDTIIKNNDYLKSYKIKGVITGKYKNNVYYLKDSSGSILVNIDKTIHIGDEISLIGKIENIEGNYVLSDTSNVVVYSKNNQLDNTNELIYNLFLDNYLYQEVDINDLIVDSISYVDDIVFAVSKNGVQSNIVISKEIDESIYNAFYSLKDDIKIGDVLDIKNAHVLNYDGKLSLNITDIYSIKKENKDKIMGYGKRHTYGINPKLYYADDLEDFNSAILNSYFSNYSGVTILFDCIDNPITFDQIAFGTHIYQLIDSYTYSYFGDNFDVITNQEITFKFYDLPYETASKYVDKTSKNTYEELTNAALFLKEDYLEASEFERLDDFEDFPIYNNNKGYLNVRNSQELWIALEYGFLPNFVYDNSYAEAYFIQAKNILRNIITNDMSEIEKIKSIYDYIAYNYSYDYDALKVNDRSLYACQYIDGLFNQGRVVCEGFAKVFSMLCAIEGIEAVYTQGYPDVGSGHAWNYVNINDNWYTVCTTYAQYKADSADPFGKFYDYSKIQWITYESFLTSHLYMNYEFPLEYMWEDIKESEEYYIYNPLQYDRSYDYVINNQDEFNELFKTIKNSGLKGNYYMTINTKDFIVHIENIKIDLLENEIYGSYSYYSESNYDTIYYTIFINENI